MGNTCQFNVNPTSCLCAQHPRTHATTCKVHRRGRSPRAADNSVWALFGGQSFTVCSVDSGFTVQNSSTVFCLSSTSQVTAAGNGNDDHRPVPPSASTYCATMQCSHALTGSGRLLRLIHLILLTLMLFCKWRFEAVLTGRND